MIRERTRSRGRSRPARGAITPVLARPHLLALLTACAAATACADSAPDRIAVTRTDSAGVTIITSSAPAWGDGEGEGGGEAGTRSWTIADSPVTSIGTVDGSPESQLHRVRDAARLEDGRVLVANRGTGEIRVYGPDGEWVRSMGGEGDGPGEFESLLDFQVLPPDTILVRDARSARVTRFTTDGELSGTRRLPSPKSSFFPPLHRLPDGRWLVDTTHGSPRGRQNGQIRTITTYAVWSEGDSTLHPIVSAPTREALSRRGESMTLSVPVPYGGSSLTAIGPDGRVAISDGQEYDIAIGSLDGSRLRVRRPFGRSPMTDALFSEQRDDFVERVPTPLKEFAREAFEQMRPPDLLPSHEDLAFDPAGNLWVERFRAPDERETTPRIWDVFDADGAWLGGVEMPDGLDVMEIGDDYVLGVQEDELDVEYVRVYEIRRP